MKKLLAILLVLALLLCTAFAEETTEVPSEAVETAEKSLTVGSMTHLSGEFFTDMWGSTTSDQDVRSLLFGYDLVEWKYESGTFAENESVVTGIAVSRAGREDRTYTISIYDDLYYSDGTRITAWDYAFSILLTTSPLIRELGGVPNTQDYIVGMANYQNGATEKISGVRVLSDTTFSITVDEAYLPFFYELGLLRYQPYPISVIAPGCEVADDGDGVYIRNIDETILEPLFTKELLESTILGEEGYLRKPSVVTGAYTLVSFDGETAQFAINPYFKGNSKGNKPYIENLTYTLADNDTMVEQLQSGELDLVNKVSKSDTVLDGMTLVSESEGAYAVQNYARQGYAFMSFCCEKATVGSEAVRKAIAECFDKDTFTQAYVGNYGMTVDGSYGVGQWMYQMVNGSLRPTTEESEEGDEEEAEQGTSMVHSEEEWASLNLDGLEIYELDTESAKARLIADGWTLNAEGEEFDPAVDTVRCKMIDEEIVPLSLLMIYPEGTDIEELMQENFIKNLAEVGIELTMEAKPFAELTSIYHREGETRDADIIYLAINFNTAFDPSASYETEQHSDTTENYTALYDTKLYDLAVDMRKTEPGDAFTYCQKWIAFQEYWTKVLPAIPIYSNVYFDFYNAQLQDYVIGEHVTCADAIIDAVMGDVADYAPEEEEEEDGDENGDEEEGIEIID